MCHVDRAGNVVEKCKILLGIEEAFDSTIKSTCNAQNVLDDEIQKISMLFVEQIRQHHNESWAMTIKNEGKLT